MGLMKCPDCGNDISERAITCIHCGCPIREWIAEQKAAEEAAEATQRTERPVYTPDEVPYPVAEEVPGDPEERAGRAGRRKKILAIIGILIIAGAGIFFAVKSFIRPDYYEEGMKVISTMSEMLKSDEFGAVIGTTDDISRVREEFKSYDFTSPIAVYSIRITDPEKYVRSVYLSKDSEMAEKWSRLTPSLKEAAENMYSVCTSALMNNSTYGFDNLAFSTVYMSVSKTDRLNNGETIDYLYVFENNSFLVSFEKGIATGRIMYAGSDRIRSAADVKEIFGDTGLEIKQVK